MLAQNKEVSKLNQDMIKFEAESTYDVFLSSTIESNIFTDKLYHCLTAEGIRVFKDDKILDISKDIPLMVNTSKIYLPIFSQYYTFSSRFLDVLVLMVEHTHKSGGKKEILPVCYDVEWLVENLDRHKQMFGVEEVERWEKALVEAVKVEPWKRIPLESEEEHITSIVVELLLKLMTGHNYGFEDLSIRKIHWVSHRASVYFYAPILLCSQVLYPKDCTY